MTCTLVRVPLLRNVGKDPIRHAIHVAGYPEFTPESVAIYKAKELAKVQPITSAFRKKGRLPIRITFTQGILLIALLANMLVMIFALGIMYTFAIAPIFWGATIICIVLCRSDMLSTMQEEAIHGWSKISYEQYFYTYGVPKEIETMATEVLMRCPNAKLSIDFLYKDPFLVGEYPGVSGEIYFGVWDENGFVG